MPVVNFPKIKPNTKPTEKLNKQKTAIIYCEGNFGEIDGKTANGLIRYSEKYKILAVIDSTKTGQDCGVILDDIPNNIPVCRDIDEALAITDGAPDSFIYGIAPVSGMLSDPERIIMLKAVNLGMNIVNGLHQFLNDDLEFAAASAANNITIHDVRKPRARTDLKVFSGRIHEVTCPRIAILGTDCAIGKRTTATVLTSALKDYGLNAVMVGTGQTGLIQGARYGVALDSIASNFCAGEVESEVIKAFENEQPDIIIVEGQSALSHPAFSSSAFILRGSCPDGVILQHAPKRLHRCDFEQMPMPEPASEITIIQAFSDTKVIGLTINHENMNDDEISAAITHYQDTLNLPATDALSRSPDDLVKMVISAFPELNEKRSATAL